MNQHIEKKICEHPPQWARFHRRWRHKPSEDELEKMMKLEEIYLQNFSRRKQ